jgi:hypothetical protein
MTVVPAAVREKQKQLWATHLSRNEPPCSTISTMRRSDVERLTPSSATAPDTTTTATTTRKCSTPKSMPSVSHSQKRPSTSRVIPVSVATSLAAPVTTRKRSSPHSSSSSSSHYRLSSSSVDAFPITESKKQTESAIPTPPRLMMMMPPIIPQFGVASKKVSLLDDNIIDDKVERVLTMPNPKSYWQTSLEFIVPSPTKDEEDYDTTYCTKKG